MSIADLAILTGLTASINLYFNIFSIQKSRSSGTSQPCRGEYEEIVEQSFTITNYPDMISLKKAVENTFALHNFI